eukprot:TRINITY_DN5851_c2_g1_i1.p1 TRINITY_DN5851_c2_g1~~TRINITY_DN5851_c2_g1_i1.p1  ORF type:complete len:370 (+),score=104.02 TRINITY_DN5851_c2_g1_i1:112-1110(+)
MTALRDEPRFQSSSPQVQQNRNRPRKGATPLRQAGSFAFTRSTDTVAAAAEASAMQVEALSQEMQRIRGMVSESSTLALEVAELKVRETENTAENQALSRRVASMAENWGSGFSELRAALQNAFVADVQDSEARKEHQRGDETDKAVNSAGRSWIADSARYDILSVQATSQVHSQQLAGLEESLVELKGAFSVELWEVRRHLTEELGVQASSFNARLAAGSACATAEVDGLRSELSEALEDSIELRRQLLALCEARARDEREHAMQPLVAAPRHEGSAASSPPMALQSDVEVLAARQEAAEQNSSRGIALLQQAVEALSIEHKLIRSSLAVH